MKINRKWLKDNGFVLKGECCPLVKEGEWYFDDVYDTRTEFYDGCVWIREEVMGRRLDNTSVNDSFRGDSYWMSLDNVNYDYPIKNIGDFKKVLKHLCANEVLSISIIETQLEERKSRLDKIRETHKI